MDEPSFEERLAGGDLRSGSGRGLETRAQVPIRWDSPGEWFSEMDVTAGGAVVGQGCELHAGFTAFG